MSLAGAAGPRRANMRAVSDDREPARINLSWLVRLRWGAIAGQLCTIAGARLVMDLPLPLAVLLLLVALEAATNVACVAWLRARRPVGNGLLAAVMALDVLVLTGLLLWSGGAYNPFSFLYLVNIALAAVVLPASWTWALLALAAAGSGLLFSGVFAAGLAGGDPHAQHAPHAQHLHTHLKGMWVAFVVAAVFIVYFVSRVRRSLAARERDLEQQRAAAARHQRLSSLATLAAGAAHELATPLGTIAMVSKELARALEGQPALAGALGAGALADVRLIRDQVDRCRAILDQMSMDAGSPRADASRAVPVGALVDAALEQLPEDRARVTVELPPAVAGTVVDASVRALAQALRGVVKNGVDATRSGPAATPPVRITGALTAGHGVELAVIDQGPGMSGEVLARAGEPFFTTKEPGQGMGLGLFLARTVAERLGGSLVIDSRPGAGTRVCIRLPARGNHVTGAPVT
jgi:two-component system, sensor histidine kinase RegB